MSMTDQEWEAWYAACLADLDREYPDPTSDKYVWMHAQITRIYSTHQQLQHEKQGKKLIRE